MLRAIFISLSKAHWAQRTITNWKIAWWVASRFIAGETAGEAIEAVRRLNQQGILATVDHLGEHTESLDTANQATGQVLDMLEEIEKAGLKSNVSIKLSQLGLMLDADEAYRNLVRIVQRASACANLVRVDMEDSSLTEITLDFVHRLKDQGFHNVGTVIQSYLYRSLEDTSRLVQRGIPVRLVKGAYKEPESVAYQKKSDVDTNFDRLSEEMIAGALADGVRPVSQDGRFPPIVAIASHDEQRIRYAIQAAERKGLPKQSLEFQMLYGIRRDLQTDLRNQGYPVRVYVPYGSHWYPYFMRRLAERPANVWFFLSNLFHR